MSDSQNTNNQLGSRSCVRQSKFFRQYESGNAIKDILGQGNLKWDENQKQGVWNGLPVAGAPPPQPAKIEQPRPAPFAHMPSKSNETRQAPFAQGYVKDDLPRQALFTQAQDNRQSNATVDNTKRRTTVRQDGVPQRTDFGDQKRFISNPLW